MSRLQKLNEEELREHLARVPGWEVVGGKLHRELRFRDFSRAFGFMASVALIAEARNHHPEWSNVYNRVVIDLTTHEAGGISLRDIELAEAVNRLVG